MQAGAILLSAVAGVFFFAALMSARWLLRQLRERMRRMDEEREGRIDAILAADRQHAIDDDA